MLPRYSFLVVLNALSVCADTLCTWDTLPSYVLTYAPLSYLYSGESYWPSDLSDFITHVAPEINFTVVDPAVTLLNVSSYGTNVALTSKDNQLDSQNIPWMRSNYGKPDESGASAAPATIIAVPKPGGVLDAFYFYFYNFNLASSILGVRFGNHVGDVEHSMVRFINGVPTYLYLSAHTGGSAYNYTAAEQTNGRATAYIASGGHANYATAGTHDLGSSFGLQPANLLNDTTDKGFIWDVTKNYRGFWYNVSTSQFTSAGGAGIGGQEQTQEGVGWLSFLGLWGDAQWPIGRPGQFCLLNQCHISDGPTGPIGKNLGRTAVCQNESNCTINSSIQQLR